MKFSHLEMVVLDWAGTAVDHGSTAPIAALEQVFADLGVPLSRALLRRSMGLAKRDHIRELLAIEDVQRQWLERHGNLPQESDVDLLYAAFTPRMMGTIDSSAKMIDGIADSVAQLREAGLRIGATTGYTREMMDRLIPLAAAKGYAPDLSLCPGDVGGGRPLPWMCFRLGIELRVSALWRAVKIGDTETDIAEGRNAGMWTIGVTRTGNGVGMTEEEWKSSDDAVQQRVLRETELLLRSAGAHYILQSAADCMPVLIEIDTRLAHGERPGT